MTYLARAMNSSDLSHKETRCDTDTLQAAALTAAMSPRLALGVLLKEGYEAAISGGWDDDRRLLELQCMVAKLVVTQSNKYKLKVNAAEVSEHMVAEYLWNRCPLCDGRGFLPLSYGDGASDELAGAECHQCLGSGNGPADYAGRERALQMTYGGKAAEFWERVLVKMDLAKYEAGREMGRRLK